MGFTSKGRRSAALCSSLILIGGVFLGFASPASTTPSDPTADGLANFASCYARNRLAAVDLVIDQSASLRTTDPGNKRVGLAKALVVAFSQLAVMESSKDARIDLAVNGFGTDYSPVVGWSTLGSASSGSITDQVEQFKDRNRDQDTDYVVALERARNDVIQHSAAMSPGDPSKVCRLVAWFTDGELSLSNAHVKSYGYTEAQGIQKICGAGGLADASRSADVFLLTAALTSPSFGSGQEQLLKAITDGSGSGPACGTTPARPYGLYSGDADFVGLLTKLIPPTMGNPAPKAESQNCPAKCVWSTTVEPLATGLTILVDSRPTGGSLTLKGPSSSTDISPSAVDVKTADGEISSREVLGLRQISIVFAKPGSGDWSIEYTPAAPGSLTVWAAPRIGVTLKASAVGKWSRGTASVARFTLISADGTPISPSQVRGLTLTAGLASGSTLTTLTVVPGSDSGTATATFTPGLNEPASSALVVASGSFTTAGGTVVPVSATLERPVLVAGAPHVVGVFDLGVVHAARSKTRDKDHRQAVLPVTAKGHFKIVSGAAGGTVCLATSKSITVGTKRYSLTPTGKNCIRLEPSTIVRYTANIAIADPTAGQVAGEIDLTTQSSDAGSNPAELHVAARGEIIIDPADPFTDSGRAVGLILLGILIPLLLWIFSAWWLAAFNKKTVPFITATSVKARLTPSRADFEVPTGADEIPPFISSNGSRRVSFESVDVKAPTRLFRPQDAIAKQSGMTLIGSLGSGSRLSRNSARIGHQIQSQWIFAVANGTVIPEGGEIEGTLYLLSNIDLLNAEQGPGGLHDRARKELLRDYETIRDLLSKPNQTRASDSSDDSSETFSESESFSNISFSNNDNNY